MTCRWIRPGICAVLSCLAIGSAPLTAQAGESTSASFRLVGSQLAALNAEQLVSAGPRYSGSGVSLGQSDALGLVGGSGTLTTLAPGFWPIAAGALPSLDTDGDGIPAWLDDDDDNDGLLDVVETRTGVFVSGSDTGTNPIDADSDDDGVSDGDEVAAGSDPNDPASTPPPHVPLSTPIGIWLLVFALVGAAWRPIAGARHVKD